MPADILLYAIVAAGLVFWLRGILGTRHGDERQRPNPFTSNPKETAKGMEAKPSGPQPRLLPEEEGFTTPLDRTMAIGGAVAEAGLAEIAKADRLFDVARFLAGSQEAFTMIVEAFAAGDRETLRGLLSDSVYTAFEQAISAREKAGQSTVVEIHAVRKSEIIEAKLEGRVAFITIRFVADETNVLRDKSGKVLSGDPDRVSETVDIWTFSRDTRSRDPAWLLCATRDEDAEKHEHKTVPDHLS